MTKHDWLFVLLRFFGLYLSANAILTVPNLVFRDETQFSSRLENIAFVVVQFGIGWFFAVRTRSICGFLERTDATPASM